MDKFKNQSQALKPLDLFLRVVFLSLLLAWCFLIAQPFIIIIMWAVIISVSLFPLYNKLLTLLRGRKAIALSLFGLVIVLLIVLPSIKGAQGLIGHADDISAFFENPESSIPPPNESVKNWPLVGETLYDGWLQASSGLEDFVLKYRTQIKGMLGWVVGTLGGVLMDVVLSFISLLIALVFLSYADSALTGMKRFATRLLGHVGEEYVLTARDTIRSVVKGILLVAFIQAGLAYIGFAAMGISSAPVLALLILILAITQLPISIVLIPLAIYSFSVSSTAAAVIFTVYMVIISFIDNLLKPMLLGRGLKVPMIVILIGSIGGMLMHGIIGLFVGSVVMAIGYQTYRLWLDQVPDEEIRS